MSNCQITQPIRLGNMELPNRLVLPPVTIFKASEEGLIGEVSLQHYREKTEGGAFGLVIVEHSYVSGEGRASAGQVSAAEDRTIDGLRQVAETIHRNGSRAVLQLNHAGGYTSREVTGSQPMAPSALRLHPQYTDIPRVMTKEDILAVEEAFVRAAERTKAAGFDGVEIHSAHTYLLNEFYIDYNHSVPGWEAIFSLGIPGLLDRAESYRQSFGNSITPEQTAYFEGIRITYEAILKLFERIAE